MNVFKLAILACAAAILPAGAQAQEKLIFNQFLPATSLWVKEIFEPWARAVEKETNGRVTVEFSAGTLGPPPRQFDMVQKGIVDVAWFLNTFEAQRLVLHQMAELPREQPLGEVAAVALWRTQQKFFDKADEYKGVKLLSVSVGPGKNMHNNKRPVETMADAKGLKLHMPPLIALKLVEGMGATPVIGPSAASYEAMSSGVVDGTFAEASTVADFKTEKFVKYSTYFPGAVSSVSFSLLMNQRRWDRLSPADKEGVMRASGENFARLSSAWDRREVSARRELAAAGVRADSAGPKLLADIAQLTSGLKADWLAKASGKGVDAQAALDFFNAEMARIKAAP